MIARMHGKTENGIRKMANDKWRTANGEWPTANGKKMDTETDYL